VHTGKELREIKYVMQWKETERGVEVAEEEHFSPKIQLSIGGRTISHSRVEKLLAIFDIFEHEDLYTSL
jgi:hypothetical protein